MSDSDVVKSTTFNDPRIEEIFSNTIRVRDLSRRLNNIIQDKLDGLLGDVPSCIN